MDVSTGAWQDLGHVQGMRTDQWAIDGTYFTLNNTLYMVYAGSPIGQDPAKFSDSLLHICLLYTSPSPRDGLLSRMPSSA